MTEAKNLWGGRFTGAADKNFAEFNRSFGFDHRLIEADIKGSIAHCNGLMAAGVLTEGEATLIIRGLGEIVHRAAAEHIYGEVPVYEDVHSFVEAHLIVLAGDAARKLHTGRSRNDQVATDLRLWLRREIDNLGALVNDLRLALVTLAEENSDSVIPGYTHLQRAQPILFAHWCLAYFEMFSRDHERLIDTRKRVNVMPLGSAALAGTSYKIDRDAVARELGFDSVSRNSLDAVSDRDFCVEFGSTCSLIMVHLSRLAEDIILYATTEFGFLELSDAVSTGSSIMPQKKNPDSMELVRGKAGRVFGDLMSLLTILKGLPLAYNKDMQEDKESVFDMVDTVSASLNVSATVLRNVRLNNRVAIEAASRGYLNATELADYLAGKSVPFREAHDVVGRMVLQAIEGGIELQELSLEQMKHFSDSIDSDVYRALSLDATLASKSQVGGTAPARVREALRAAREMLDRATEL